MSVDLIQVYLAATATYMTGPQQMISELMEVAISKADTETQDHKDRTEYGQSNNRDLEILRAVIQRQSRRDWWR